MKRLAFGIALSLIIITLIGLGGPLAVGASPLPQATDSLRRTPRPTATLTPVPPTIGWRGQILKNQPYATAGGGSIVRVQVFERVDEPITLTYYDTTLSGHSGSKPEYGPYTAEFAPVPAGRWTVSLPNLNASVEIETDGFNLVIVEFAPFTAAEATVAAQSPPTPTPVGGQPWEGRLISVGDGPLLDGAILRVKVQDQTGRLVQVATSAGFSTQSITGAKEELDPDVAEFAPLTTGRYVITPAGLNASLTIDLERYTSVVVEFRPIGDWPRPTATPTSPPGTPTPTPSATPTPQMQWIGAVLRHEKTYRGRFFASVAVRVNGMQDLPVYLSAGDTRLTCNTGTKPEYGDYACEFGGLAPGIYTISAQGLDPVIPVMVDQGDFVLAEFRQEPLPSEPAVWLGRVVRNSSQPQPGNGVSSAVAVSVEGRRGQVVSIRSAAGWEAFCNTGTKPEYGDYVCEFGGLWPGVYTLLPVGIPAQVSLYMDGVGFAEVAFELLVATATPPPTPTRLIGAGASPITPPTPTPLPTPTVRRVTATPTPWRPPPTVTSTPTVTPTTTPALGWVGRVLQDDPGVGVGTIVVRVLGLKDQPVVLRSGAWSTRGFSGSKPEYGEYSLEFASLGAGEYSVELEGLGATLPVRLRPGGFLLVEFRYDVLPTPTPTPQRGVWVGAVTRNTSGETRAGAWSTAIVKVAGVEGLTVDLETDGFTTTCITGSKPEYGSGACEVGGLWPGRYRVTPRGLGPSVDVWLDGRGSATVEFWIR